MLKKPMLLLNPYAVRNTVTAVQPVRAAGAMMEDGMGRHAPMREMAMRSRGGAGYEGGMGWEAPSRRLVNVSGGYASIDFHDSASVVLANQTPEDGSIVISLEELQRGGGNLVQVRAWPMLTCRLKTSVC